MKRILCILLLSIPATGERYIVAVRHGRFQFNPSSQVVTPDDDASDIDPIGDTK